MPLLMVPTCGLSDHVKAVLEVPLTSGVNVALCPPVSDAVPGDRLTLITGGSKIRVTDAVLLGSAWLMAVTVTVCGEEMLLGAVYTPLNTLPTSGVSDQFTP